MLKMKLKNLFWVSIALFCATQFCSAQSSDIGPTVEVPPSPPAPALPNSDSGMTIGSEYKSTKNVITPEEKPAKWWSVTMEVGYSSEYIFRGTNLTPNSDGIEWQQIVFSGKGFTLGAWYATQIGTAEVANATVVGESSGAFSPFGAPAFPEFEDFAVQSRFKELDIFASYTHSFGPIDITFGNIAFFIFRSETDHYTFLPTGVPCPFPGSSGFGPCFEAFGVPENEQFDRLFLAVSTNKIHPFGIPIIPTVTYYQTILNEANAIRTPGVNGVGPDTLGMSEEEYELTQLAFKRNDKLGGYLEGKIQSVIPIVGNVLRLEPTAIISYSVGDRSEAISISQAQWLAHNRSLAKPLYGFNHFQTGAELVLQISRWMSVSGFGNYAYHIANPTAGTDRNEWWGGGKVTVSF
jgi:hypothetical protein